MEKSQNVKHTQDEIYQLGPAAVQNCANLTQILKKTASICLQIGFDTAENEPPKVSMK